MEFRIELKSETQRLELFGPADEHLRILREAMNVKITARDGVITVTGKKNDVKKATDIIERMQQKLARVNSLNVDDVKDIITRAEKEFAAAASDALVVYSHKKNIEPFTQGQRNYIKAMLKRDLTFCIGPAGTGKTYLAVAVAVSMLKKRQIRKIVLARPAVEAGERLGFLPGDLQAKVNPYLRPLFDAIEDMMDFAQMRKFMDMDIIEIIPLAFMRGRTLNEAVVICDEAQNTLPSQMLMVLTRLGRGSKMIITGDVTQIDLEADQTSGMIDAMNVLEGVENIASVELGESDIVRHKLVQNIVQAYSKRKLRSN